MKHTGLYYTVAAHVEATKPEVEFLHGLALNHYDSVCKSAARAGPNAFLNGWLNEFIVLDPDAAEGTVKATRLTGRQLDTLLKILEAANLLGKQEAARGRVMSALFRSIWKGLQAEERLLNLPKEAKTADEGDPRYRLRLYPLEEWVDERHILRIARDYASDDIIKGGFGANVDEAIRQMEAAKVATFADAEDGVGDTPPDTWPRNRIVTFTEPSYEDDCLVVDERTGGQRLLASKGDHDGDIRVRLLTETQIQALGDGDWKLYRRRVNSLVEWAECQPNLNDPATIRTYDFMRNAVKRETERRKSLGRKA